MFQRRRAAEPARNPARKSKQRAKKPAQRATRIITSSAAFEALTYPLRQELIDTLQAFGGEASAGELAEQLGRPVDGLYYHLRLLRKCKLIVETQARNAAGRLERRYRIAMAGNGQLRLAYRPEKPRDAAALRKVVAGMLRIAGRDFNDALDGESVEQQLVVEGERRELWAARSKGWVSEADLKEINRLLAQLHVLLERPRDEHRTHLTSLCFVLAPVAARAKRRGDDAGSGAGAVDDDDDDE